MKRLVIFLMLFILTGITGCEKEEDTEEAAVIEGRQVADASDDDFKIILYSEKDIYSETDEVSIFATIEYIGSKKSIDIFSGEPYAGFIVESEGVEYISNLVLTLLKTTTLKKGEVHTFPLVKAGGFNENDEDAEFWREFYMEEKMLFPKGEYNLSFSTGFYLEKGTDYQLGVEYQFQVK